MPSHGAPHGQLSALQGMSKASSTLPMRSTCTEEAMRVGGCSQAPLNWNFDKWVAEEYRFHPIDLVNMLRREGKEVIF